MTNNSKICLEKITQKILNNTNSVIKNSEKYYENELDEACRQILINRSKRIICVTGPSSSGKTTTADLIIKKLLDNGIKSQIVSLDNFYKHRDDLPILDNGDTDFESINALNLSLVQNVVGDLITKGIAVMPLFDFKAGRRIDCAEEIKIEKDTVVVIEGIHALHEGILGPELDHITFKIYISVSSDFILNDRTVLTSRELRLTRRIIRDNKTRGSSAENTLSMWDGVCFGEDMYIRPFKETADINIDSTINYEIFVYKSLILPLIKSINSDSIHFNKVKRLIDFYSNIPNISEKLVPQHSLLTEFI